ncbi:MAG: hydrolase, partial [Lachnospiraceae bacterium]|nr:hydrolase [Lachnospiraceae bacterium]
MNLYISDLHLGHSNVIGFDNRPFADRNEMDHTMIELWNSRVSAEDDVYIVGDFCFRSDRTPDWYLRQLKGHKHLIVGNHDRVTLDCENAARYLESIDKMLCVKDGDKQVCLCHYPIADWYKGRHGSWHVYGHIHGYKGDVYQLMKSRERALNAAACINNYTPASMEEL